MNKLKSRFVELNYQAEGGSKGSYLITCDVTGERMAWNDACNAGWVADRFRPGKFLSPAGRESVRRSTVGPALRLPFVSAVSNNK